MIILYQTHVNNMTPRKNNMTPRYLFFAVSYYPFRGALLYAGKYLFLQHQPFERRRIRSFKLHQLPRYRMIEAQFKRMKRQAS